MRTYLGLLASAVRTALRSKHDLVLENLALRQQVAVPQALLQGRRDPLDQRYTRYDSAREPQRISATTDPAGVRIEGSQDAQRGRG